MRTLLVPVRINFIGGWSDQVCWPHHAAVVNASVGWYSGWEHDPYPCVCEYLEDAPPVFKTVVDGVGTGLGISGIRAAVSRHDKERISGKLQYVQRSLEWERESGTKGGWQDCIGAIEPGFKLIETDDHVNFTIRYRDDHPILTHIVLFDTGLRRDSCRIGDQIRQLIADSSSGFVRDLSAAVRRSEFFFNTEDVSLSWICLMGYWKQLCRHVPDMVVDGIPEPQGTWGHTLAGAGGGGWGIMFVEDPDQRERVVSDLKQAKFPAFIPVLLDGVKWETQEWISELTSICLEGQKPSHWRESREACKVF